MNHPFVDGNKRVGHAAMETFLTTPHELVRGKTAPVMRSLAGEGEGEKTMETKQPQGPFCQSCGMPLQKTDAAMSLRKSKFLYYQVIKSLRDFM